MSAPITIYVGRDDGEVTKLEGASGIAVAVPALNEQIELSDPGLVSMRCSTQAEIAWNLACILATVKRVAPEAYDMAHKLESIIRPDKPQVERKLPRWKKP